MVGPDVKGARVILFNADDKLKFIGCEIIYREACKLAAESPLRVDVEFFPKGLHDLERTDMLARLQEAVDRIGREAGYRAILLGYARCNDGLAGLTARSVPLVIPKAHDCITFFFGSRSSFQRYFDAHPGTYYHTTGWMERDNPEVTGSQGVMSKLGLDQDYEQLVAKYGKENADFIAETMGGGLQHYDRICYLEMDVTDERAFIERSRQEAERNGWTFDLRKGEWSLLERLFRGEWEGGDFLMVPPGHRIVARNDGEVLGVVKDREDADAA